MPKQVRKILIVEDVAEMLEMLRLIIDSLEDSHGDTLGPNKGTYKVQAAVPSLWGARVELSKALPDLVLLDEVLPGESVIDFLKDGTLKGVPVLLMTGMQNPTHAIPGGTLGRIKKPQGRNMKADQDYLRQELDKALKKA